MWLSSFLFGRAGSEQSFDDNPADIQWREEEIKEEDRNLNGDKIKSLVKIIPKISVSYPNASIGDVNKFKSIQNDVTNTKKLLMSDALVIIDEPRVSSAVSTLELQNSSRAGITITGVWLASDTAHEGTNYYTGGSYDEETNTATLGTPLPHANEEVIVNYSYQGWYVDVVNMDFSNSNTKPFTTDINIELEGI